MSMAIGHPRSRRLAWNERRARRRRRMLARGLQLALDDARHPPRGLTARVTVRRDQVLDAAAEIEALVARLRDEREVSEHGLERARALLLDGDGPLYSWAEPGTLRRHVRVILEAME
jgi:hypothetical protein